MKRRLSGWAMTLMVLSLVLCLEAPLQASCSGTRGRTVTALAACGSGSCTCVNCTCTNCTSTTCQKKSGTLNIVLSPAALSLLNKMPGLRAVVLSMLSIASPQTLLADSDDDGAAVTGSSTCSGTCSGACSGTCSMGGSQSCTGSGSGSCSGKGSGGCKR